MVSADGSPQVQAAGLSLHGSHGERGNAGDREGRWPRRPGQRPHRPTGPSPGLRRSTLGVLGTAHRHNVTFYTNEVANVKTGSNRGHFPVLSAPSSQTSCLAALPLNLGKVHAGGKATCGLGLRQQGCVREPCADRAGGLARPPFPAEKATLRIAPLRCLVCSRRNALLLRKSLPPPPCLVSSPGPLCPDQNVIWASAWISSSLLDLA